MTSWQTDPRRWYRTAVAVALAIPLTGCTFDYLNNLDRVTFADGNAVKANLEQQTINPATRAAYKTRGLGANDGVIPKDKSATDDSADASTGTGQ